MVEPKNLSLRIQVRFLVSQYSTPGPRRFEGDSYKVVQQVQVLTGVFKQNRCMSWRSAS